MAEGLDLSQAQIGALQIAARLHDLGGVAVPEGVTNHVGPLTEEQWEIVRRHPAAGADLLKHLSFFGNVAEIIHAHHESFDGTGYPDLRAGEEIPLLARILCVADAFEAMTSPRPYREACSIDAALEQIRKLAGQQFDLRVAEVFLSLPRETLQDIQASNR
jgi:HD-GYP domain-containing protein (c-di-GMP phosphodiesterase class II)